MTPRFPGNFWHLRTDVPLGEFGDSAVPAPTFAWPTDDWSSAYGPTPALGGDEAPRLDELLDTEDGPCRCAVHSLHPRRKPVGLFLPEKYEPRYPYPLILWLHGAGGTELELFSTLPVASSRNYVGLSLRGPLRREAGGFDWDLSADGLAQLEADVYGTVCKLRQTVHVHSERVVLAGFDTGATAALELLLRKPEWFGGAVSICGRLPRAGLGASENAASAEDAKRVLLIGGDRDDVLPASEVLQAHRLLRSAPLSLSIAVEDAGHEVTRPMLRRVDQWVMDGIYATV
jgi:phospholipase/carboxylesterase